MNKPWTYRHQAALKRTLKSYIETGERPFLGCMLCQTARKSKHHTLCFGCSWIIMTGRTCFNNKCDTTGIKDYDYKYFPLFGRSHSKKRIRDITKWLAYWESC